MKQWFVFLMGGAALLASSIAFAADIPKNPKIPETQEAVEAGKVIFYKRCSFCHGLTGKGDGPVADQLNPRPRDFNLALYKFRTTNSGELPTDEDLFRVISRGIPGTAMQTFDLDKVKSGLSEEERWKVIYYLKTLFEDFVDPEFDPYQQVVKVAPQIPSSPESIAKGAELFKKMKCWECHGEGGRGNGPNAPRLKDAKKNPILPFDLTKGWRYKGGNTANDIYMRFNTGINGTPMPSFSDSLNDEERWHLANYVASLQKNKIRTGVLTAKYVKEDLDLDPESSVWEKAQSVDVLLSGQVIAAPRWENPSVDLVTVKAAYNDKDIAFLLEWGDRFKDTIHKKDMEVHFDNHHTYVKPATIPRELDTFRDSIALQFPVKSISGTEKPHFFRGNSGNRVNLWVWKSDLEHRGDGVSVEDSNASGFKKPTKLQKPGEQQARGKGIWKGGVWKVVIVRPLATPDKRDVQFEKGKFLPFSLNAWDGSNGEHGRLMSLSSWRYLVLESSTPVRVYFYALFAAFALGIAEVGLARRYKNNRKSSPRKDTEKKMHNS